jgi:hypothetical protein
MAGRTLFGILVLGLLACAASQLQADSAPQPGGLTCATSAGRGAAAQPQHGTARTSAKSGPSHAQVAAKGEKIEVPARQEAKQPASTHHSSKSHNLFIPPPPPTVPISGELSPLTGVPVDFMSPADLKRREQELQTELAQTKKDIELGEKTADEKRQRSTLFASLYTEGVVSRRELETSQEEDSDSQNKLRVIRQKLDDVQFELKQLDARLKKLAKSTAGKDLPSPKHEAGKAKSKKLD